MTGKILGPNFLNQFPHTPEEVGVHSVDKPLVAPMTLPEGTVFGANFLYQYPHTADGQRVPISGEDVN